MLYIVQSSRLAARVLIYDLLIYLLIYSGNWCWSWSLYFGPVCATLDIEVNSPASTACCRCEVYFIATYYHHHHFN